ncbi:hypothetical protein M9458_031346, partial [Cirrhinus mrigala]
MTSDRHAARTESFRTASSDPSPVPHPSGPSRETRTRWLTDPRSPEQPAREIYGRPSPRRSTGTISLTAFFSRYM